MTRRPTILALISLLALGLGACAKAGSNGNANTAHLSPFQLVSAAASKTTAEKTARMTMSMHLGGGTSGQRITMTGSGQMDLANNAASLSFDMSGIPGMQSSLTFDMILSGGAMYMKIPQNLARSGGTGMPAGKSWIKIDIAAIAKQSGMNIPGFSGGSLGAFDPAQQLAYLKGVSNSVKDEGAQTIGGIQTEHYHVVIDLQKAIQRISGRSACGLGSLEKQFASQLGNRTVPADVWIDRQQHLRQMKMTFDVHGLTMDMQMDLSDFGAPVHVTVPPASEVYDITPTVSSALPKSCGTTT